MSDELSGVTSPVGGEDTVLNDDESANSAVECEAEFDDASLLYTELDRQWYCSVSSVDSVTSDELYFNADGTAVFSRYGQVFWNRNLPGDEINVASPFISSFVMRDIRSANTTLQFTSVSESEADQQYDCVLVGRTASASASLFLDLFSKNHI